MTAAVLDASALLVLILGEPGGDKVQRVLTDCAMTAVNLSEVIGHFAGIGASEADIRLMLDPLPLVPVALDEELAFATGPDVACDKVCRPVIRRSRVLGARQ
jgi:ribonuclease VapC